MRRSRVIPLLTSVMFALVALAAAGCGGSGEKLLPADQARSLDSALQQVSDATRAGECRQALSALTSAQRIYAALPASIDERLSARVKDGLDQLAKTVPTQCDAVPDTPAKPAVTTTGTTGTSTSTPPTTTTTTTPTTTTTTPTTTTTTTPTQTDTGTTPNGGITPEATGTGTTP